MGKKGQALVLFVMILPIIVMLFAYIFDQSLIIIENKKLESIAKDSITYMYEEKGYSDIKNFIKENDKNIKIKNIDIDNLSIKLEKNINSYFGKILGFDNYKIKQNKKGIIKDNKLYIEKR